KNCEMKQWDIYLYPFDNEKPHPVVILSNNERIAARTSVNGLLCRTLRANKPLNSAEVPLDRADGLDWATAVNCEFIYQMDKTLLREQRGQVSYERRGQITRKIIEALRLPF